MARVCVTGIWHQGSVVSACLADLGNEVRGVCDPETATALMQARPPVFEPELPEIIARNVTAGRLTYGSDYQAGLGEAEFVFICTDTAVDHEDQSDVAPIFAIAEEIGRHSTRDIVLCVTAQVPIGTSSELAEVVRRQSPEFTCVVAYIPEFLRLGIAVDTFREADRFVIGCDDDEVAGRVAGIFEPLGRPVIRTDLASAEMAKHASNAFLATSISFINEMADLCERLGADASQVAQILKLDRRIGPHAFLSPGLGFAGGTLGREIRALQKLGRASGAPTLLMDAVWEVNQRRPELVSRRLTRALGGLSGRRVTLLGLTYKAGTSTMRRAISLDIARDLVAQGAVLGAFDPLADLDEVDGLPPIEIAADPYEAARGRDALVLVTEWAGIDELDLGRVRQSMSGDVFLDTRNLLDPGRMAEEGFRYYRIGV